jgi:hypothetical protein
MSQQLDSDIARLDQAVERVRANLVDLELDADRRFLDAGELEGDSRTRLDAADAAIADLWQQHSSLEQLLTRARWLRKRGWWIPQYQDELRELLEGPSIVLEGPEVPMADRGLLGEERRTERMTPFQLLDRMSASFDEAKAVYTQIASATRAAVPTLRAAQDRIGQAAQAAERLGLRSRPDLLGAEERCNRLADRVLHDPLSVDLTEIEKIGHSVDEIGAELSGMLTLSEEIVGRLDQARAQLESLRELTSEGAAAHEVLQARIAGDAAPVPIELGPELGGQLERVAELADAGAWPDAQRELTSLTKSLQALTDRAEAILVANRAPLQERDRLRGMLDAYRAKAGRLGIVEDPDLLELFARAQEALYQAPTDLSLADDLVRGYQQRVLAHEATR